jgi:hypothetical protein
MTPMPVDKPATHFPISLQETKLSEDPKKRNPGLNEFQKAQRAADGKKAMQEYQSESIAMRAKTERLKALREARDAAEEAAPKPVVAPKKAAKKVAGKKK